jgi:hypothetical protein
MIVNRHHHHQHAPTLARGAHARRRRRQQRARRDSVVMYGIGRIASQREREGGREGESRPHRAAGCLLRLLQGALQPLLRQRRCRATGINSVEAEPPAARTRAVRPRRRAGGAISRPTRHGTAPGARRAEVVLSVQTGRSTTAAHARWTARVNVISGLLRSAVRVCVCVSHRSSLSSEAKPCGSSRRRAAPPSPLPSAAEAASKITGSPLIGRPPASAVADSAAIATAEPPCRSTCTRIQPVPPEHHHTTRVRVKKRMGSIIMRTD